MFGASLIAFVLAQSSTQDQAYIVRQSQFECLIRHLPALTRAKGDLIWIDLTTCPPRVIRRADAWPILPRADTPNAVDNKIVLTRADIMCLSRNRNRPGRFATPVSAGRYRLSFEACRR